MESYTMAETFQVWRYTHAAALWRKYARDVGDEELKKAYGDDWPRTPIEEERIFACGKKMGEGIIGWGCVRRDSPNHIAWLMLGIWPEYQKQGYSVRLSHWLANWAFGNWAVDAVCIQVLRSNKEYIKTRLQRTHSSPWKYVGYMDIPPPGSLIFGVKREEWGFWKDKGKCEL